MTVTTVAPSTRPPAIHGCPPGAITETSDPAGASTTRQVRPPSSDRTTGDPAGAASGPDRGEAPTAQMAPPAKPLTAQRLTGPPCGDCSTWRSVHDTPPSSDVST